jgi:hypothetical protein
MPSSWISPSGRKRGGPANQEPEGLLTDNRLAKLYYSVYISLQGDDDAIAQMGLSKANRFACLSFSLSRWKISIKI